MSTDFGDKPLVVLTAGIFLQIFKGGDYEEAVMDGLKTATQQINWRKYAHRVIVRAPSLPQTEGWSLWGAKISVLPANR